MEEQDEKKKRKKSVLVVLAIALLLISIGGCIATQISNKEDSSVSAEIITEDTENKNPATTDDNGSGLGLNDSGVSSELETNSLGDVNKTEVSTDNSVTEDVGIEEGNLSEETTNEKKKDDGLDENKPSHDNDPSKKPEMIVAIQIPADSHTDEVVDIYVKSATEVYSIDWSGSRNEKDIVLADYIEGDLLGEGARVKFKQSGRYMLRARVMDRYGQEDTFTNRINVYPIPTLEFKIPELMYSSEQQSVSIDTKFTEDCKIEVYASVDDGEKVPYGQMAEGILTDTGGLLTFETEKTSKIKFFIKLTDPLKRVFEYESNEAVLKPSPKFDVSKVEDTYRNDTVQVKVTGLSGLEGKGIVWLLAKDGLSVKFDDYVVTPFTNNGGELKFSSLGKYVLSGTVTNDLNREFTKKQEINIVNAPPTTPTVSYSVEKPGVKNKFKVSLTALSTDRDKDSIVYEWEGKTVDDYYPVGETSLRVRAKDSVGLYSDWATVKFEVKNTTPTLPILEYELHRQPPINDKFKVDLKASSVDTDNEAITYEWKDATEDNLYGFGDHKVQARATDVNGASSEWATLDFSIVNKMPTKPEATILVKRPGKNGLFNLEFDQTSTDPDGDSLTYVWKGKKDSGLYEVGIHNFKVQAVDEFGGQSEWADINFEIVNTKPPMPTTSYSVERPGVDNKFKVNFTQESIDADGDDVTYEWLGRTENDYYPVGETSLKVRAIDINGACSDYSPVGISIRNATPTIPNTTFKVHRQPVLAGDKFKVDLTATSTDADGDSITYEWLDTVVDGNYEFGDYKPKVRAVDVNGAASAWKEVPFSVVNNPPTKPIATATIQPITINGLFKVDLTQISTDPDGDTITYKWENTALNNLYGVGEQILRVYAVDQFGAQSEKTELKFTVVNTTPTKPTVTSEVIKPAVSGKYKVNFTTASTDENGSKLDYLITPDPVDFMYTLGVYTVSVVARDEHGGLSEPTLHEFEVINTPPTNPTATASVVKPGKDGKFKVNFTATGSTDADGDAIEYKWEGRSADDTYSIGSHKVYVYAIDVNNGISDKIEVPFEITNTAPTVPTKVTATPTTTYDGSKTLVNFSASGSTDADGDVITYEWDGRGSDNFERGNYSSVKVRAKDPNGAVSDWKTVSFTVENRAPSKPSSAYTTVTTTVVNNKTKVNFYVDGSSDPDGDKVSYEWSGRTSNDYYDYGSHSVKVRATDGRGGYSNWVSMGFDVVAANLWVFCNGDIPEVTGGWHLFDGAMLDHNSIFATAFGLSKPSFQNLKAIDIENYNRCRVVYSVRNLREGNGAAKTSLDVFGQIIGIHNTDNQEVTQILDITNATSQYIKGSSESYTYDNITIRVHIVELFNSDVPIRSVQSPQRPKEEQPATKPPIEPWIDKATGPLW